MKLVVFAHTPPPFHGQSYMVQAMLEGFAATPAASGASHGITCYHVNARLSADLGDVGSVRVGKVLRTIGYCAEAIVYRFRLGVRTFYYVPAPGKRGALYRDWVVMILCRPFYRRIVFHWHSVGLGEWLQSRAQPWERWLTRRLLGGAELSIVSSRANLPDAQALCPRAAAVVPNGIPDPCPDFASRVLPVRLVRESQRAAGGLSPPGGDAVPQIYRVLFMALCTEDKGVFDALEAVALANEHLAARGDSARMNLTIAGTFPSDAERERFENRAFALRDAVSVNMAGFVSRDRKAQLLEESDCLCFPTYYRNEGQPLNVIEAMAYGLAIVTTEWRGIPEALPSGYEFLCKLRDVPSIADALLKVKHARVAERLREHYRAHFTTEQHLRDLAAALRATDVDALSLRA